jgi:hypothetical protein
MSATITRDPYYDVANIVVNKLVKYISMYVVMDVATVNITNTKIYLRSNPTSIVIQGSADFPSGNISGVYINLYDANNVQIGGFIGRFSASINAGTYNVVLVASMQPTEIAQAPPCELLTVDKPIREVDPILKIPVLYVGSDRYYQREAIYSGIQHTSGSILIAKAVIPRKATYGDIDRYFVGRIARSVLSKQGTAEMIQFNYTFFSSPEVKVADLFNGYPYFLSIGDAVVGTATANIAGVGSASYFARSKSALNPGVYDIFTSMEVHDGEQIGVKFGDCMATVRMMDIMKQWMVGGIDGTLYIDNAEFPIKLPSAVILASEAQCNKLGDMSYVLCTNIHDAIATSLVQVRIDQLIGNVADGIISGTIPQDIASSFINNFNQCINDLSNINSIYQSACQTSYPYGTYALYSWWAHPPMINMPWVDAYLGAQSDGITNAKSLKVKLYVPLYLPSTDVYLKVIFNGDVTVKILPVEYDVDAYYRDYLPWKLGERKAAVYTGSGTLTYGKGFEECRMVDYFPYVPGPTLPGQGFMSASGLEPGNALRPMQIVPRAWNCEAPTCSPPSAVPAISIPVANFAKNNFLPVIIEYTPARMSLSDIANMLDVFTFGWCSSKMLDEDAYSNCINICANTNCSGMQSVSAFNQCYNQCIQSCQPKYAINFVTTKCLNNLLAKWIYHVYAPFMWVLAAYLVRPTSDGGMDIYVPTVDGSYVSHITRECLDMCAYYGLSNCELYITGFQNHTSYKSGNVPYLAINEAYRFIRGTA